MQGVGKEQGQAHEESWVSRLGSREEQLNSFRQETGCLCFLEREEKQVCTPDTSEISM